MTIRIRVEGEKPVEVSNKEFRTLVRDGVVVSDTPVWGKIFTDGEWWTAADLQMFHDNTPRSAAKGPHLLEEERRAERADAQTAQIRVLQEAHMAKKVDAFGLRTLTACVTARTLGAARLWISPSFRGDRVVTVIFHPHMLQVTLTQAASNYWAGMPRLGHKRQPDGTFQQQVANPFEVGKVVHSSKDLPVQEASSVFASWTKYLSTASRAVDCQTPTVDGISFIHEFLAEGNLSSASWSNPRPEKHPSQCELIAAHRALAEQFINLRHI